MRRVPTVLAASVVLLATMNADTIELKTGEKIEGAFRQAGTGGAIIEVGGQPVTFPMEKVRAIYLGAVMALPPGPSPLGEAIDALRSLRSVTTSGINYREYSTRVLDVKIVIDRYRDSGANDPSRDAILAAMKYYEMGSQAWGGRVLPSSAAAFGQMVELGRGIRADSCIDLAVFVNSADSMYAKSKKPVPEEQRLALIGSMGGGSVPLFWKCGKEQVTLAETMASK